MTISVNKFRELIKDNNIDDYVAKVEYDIDNAIKKYASLDADERKNYITVFMPEYWFKDEHSDISWYDKEVRQGRQHLGRILKELSNTDRQKVREKVIDDYEDAGWNVNWDLAEVGDGRQAFVLTIALPENETEDEDGNTIIYD